MSERVELSSHSTGQTRDTWPSGDSLEKYRLNSVTSRIRIETLWFEARCLTTALSEDPRVNETSTRGR